MDFLNKVFGNKSTNLTVSNNDGGFLKQPGDKLEARVTNSNRKVLKASTDGGNSKYSATQYPNGTIVETRTTKKK